jgi:hypothetical protein
MDKVPTFVDMKIDDKGPMADMMPEAPKPSYPYGLSICLQKEQLDKLGLDDSCSVGDLLHGHFLAEVTSVSKHQTEQGDNCRVEMQIKYLSAESEGEENKEVEASMPKLELGKFYKR